jgi:hypothetical protein
MNDIISNEIPPSPQGKPKSEETVRVEPESESPKVVLKRITTEVQKSVEIDHIQTKQEFERQVHGRMDVTGVEYSRTKMIKVDEGTFAKLKDRQKECYRTIPALPGFSTNKSNGKKYTPSNKATTYQYEVDLHITVDEVEEGKALDLATIMAVFLLK